MKEHFTPSNDRTIRSTSPSKKHPDQGRCNGKTGDTVKPAKKAENGIAASRRKPSNILSSFSKAKPTLMAQNTADSVGSAVASADESVRPPR